MHLFQSVSVICWGGLEIWLVCQNKQMVIKFREFKVTVWVVFPSVLYVLCWIVCSWIVCLYCHVTQRFKKCWLLSNKTLIFVTTSPYSCSLMNFISPQVFNAKTAEVLSHHQVEINQSFPKEGWVPWMS